MEPVVQMEPCSENFSFEKEELGSKSCRNLFFFSKCERMKDTGFVHVYGVSERNWNC